MTSQSINSVYSVWHLGADDTNVFCSGDDSDQLFQEVKTEIIKNLRHCLIGTNHLRTSAYTKMMIFKKCGASIQVQVQADRVKTETFLVSQQMIKSAGNHT